MAGIERRAGRIRRHRMAASVAGAALTVAAIAIAVPSLVPDRDGAVGPGSSTTATPSAPAAGDYGPNELDPAHPWAYRSHQNVLGNGNLETLRREWQVKHPGAELAPLYGHVYEPQEQSEIAFVSHAADEDRWGVALSSEAGFIFSVDELLPPHATVLMTPLRSYQEPTRLLIIAGPATGQIAYAADGSTFQDVPSDYGLPGIGYAALDGDTSHDAVRVLDGNGNMDNPVYLGPAPDYADTPATTVQQPANYLNYLNWPTRGTVDARTESQAISAFAQAKGTTDDKVGHHVLWGGTDKSGRQLVFMVAWVDGGSAQTFGFVSTGEPFLGPVIGKSPDVLAYLASGAPGTTTDVLVVLPRLGAGPFSYAVSATAPYRQVGNARSDLENVAVIYRDPKATSDRLKVLDGDGMKVLYDGAVQPLLCGASSCG
jgi:hypothetical protein